MADATPIILGVPVTGALVFLVGRAIYSASQASDAKRAREQRERLELAVSAAAPKPQAPVEERPPDLRPKALSCQRCNHRFTVGADVVQVRCPNCASVVTV